MKITFPDGAVKEFNEGTTALEVARSISEGLAKRMLVAKVNDKVVDLCTPITSDSKLELLSWDNKEGKSTFWHSSAHLMAEALEAYFPGIKFGIGPPVENGFYYDVDLGNQHISEEDLAKLEKKMAELAAKNSEYKRSEISKADAVKYFTEKGDEYKLDLIKDLNDGEITFYQQGNFTDLCRGPHIPNTGFIKAIKLTSIAGAYWRGDSNNKQLTRIYGITFPKQKDLEDYLNMLEEAKKRDHRKIGKEMEIFVFDDTAFSHFPPHIRYGNTAINKFI